MASLETLLDDARPGLAAAPDPIILGALRRAAREFFRQSQAWQELLDPIPTQAGVNTYSLGAPNGARVERVLWMKHNGRVMPDQASMSYLTSLGDGGGEPSAWAMPAAGQDLTVWPTPKEAGTLTAFVCLVPLRSAMSLPDALLDEYGPGLIALARADVLGNSPGMPYHDPAAAAVQFNFGNDWIVRAKRKQTSGAWSNLRARPNPLA